MKKFRKGVASLVVLVTLFTFGFTTLSSRGPVIPDKCIVCNMKIDKSSAFKYKYKGKFYYFDTYNCKETFRMNPEKFIDNVCTPQVDSM